LAIFDGGTTGADGAVGSPASFVGGAARGAAGGVSSRCPCLETTSTTVSTSGVVLCGALATSATHTASRRKARTSLLFEKATR